MLTNFCRTSSRTVNTTSSLRWRCPSWSSSAAATSTGWTRPTARPSTPRSRQTTTAERQAIRKTLEFNLIFDQRDQKLVKKQRQPAGWIIGMFGRRFPSLFLVALLVYNWYFQLNGGHGHGIRIHQLLNRMNLSNVQYRHDVFTSLFLFNIICSDSEVPRSEF